MSLVRCDCGAWCAGEAWLRGCPRCGAELPTKLMRYRSDESDMILALVQVLAGKTAEAEGLKRELADARLALALKERAVSGRDAREPDWRR